MVGVPRSSGCQLCRKRRVKCDEARPGCGNCDKYGASCPGYERGIKFVAGKHEIRQRAPRSAREKSSGSRASSQVMTPGSTSSNSSTIDVPRQRTLQLVATPSPNRGQFINTIIDTISDVGSQRDVNDFVSWVEFDRLGNKAALDGAVCSLALQLVGKNASNDTMIAHSRTLYGQSLQALQASLRHPTEWKSSETLCSAILCCAFEMFAGTSSSDTWLQHARGIGVLIEQRGAAAHAGGWDAAMLLAFRGTLIMSDMFYPMSQDCFLSRPEWKPVARDGGRRLVHEPDAPDLKIRLMDTFSERLAEVPGILKGGYELREANKQGTPPDLAKVAVLIKDATACHAKFTSWYEDFEATSILPEEVPTNDPDSLYPTVLRFETPWVGSMIVGYWASMLILEEVLNQCKWPVNFDESQRKNVQNILRSVELVGKGILGPYRMGYAMRIAYEFASAEAQVWIRAQLDKYSKSYAATDKRTYPSPRKDEAGYS